jgi:hypothetical protein
MLLWLAQVAMGAIIAVICFYLVKVRYLAIHIFGLVIAAYFVFDYILGFITSIRAMIDGVWSQAFAAGVNVLLATVTVMCAWWGRAARIRQLREERSFGE